jgi:hypothetical protein
MLRGQATRGAESQASEVRGLVNVAHAGYAAFEVAEPQFRIKIGWASMQKPKRVSHCTRTILRGSNWHRSR